jgi:hypothetical protein
VGSVENRRYSVKDVDEVSASNRIYSVEYEGEKSELIPTERMVDCSLSCSEICVAGQVYEVARGEFHETYVPTEQMSVTVVWTDRASNERPLVIGDVDVRSGRRYEYERANVDRTDFLRWLDCARKFASL